MNFPQKLSNIKRTSLPIGNPNKKIKLINPIYKFHFTKNTINNIIDSKNIKNGVLILKPNMPNKDEELFPDLNCIYEIKLVVGNSELFIGEFIITTKVSKEIVASGELLIEIN